LRSSPSQRLRDRTLPDLPDPRVPSSLALSRSAITSASHCHTITSASHCHTHFERSDGNAAFIIEAVVVFRCITAAANSFKLHTHDRISAAWPNPDLPLAGRNDPAAVAGSGGEVARLHGQLDLPFLAGANGDAIEADQRLQGHAVVPSVWRRGEEQDDFGTIALALVCDLDSEGGGRLA